MADRRRRYGLPFIALGVSFIIVEWTSTRRLGSTRP